MALKRITLRDFVIVQELTLDLQTGFTVLTGETGAGKSILVDALQLALGSRADAGYVREGASHADVCAEFDYPCHCNHGLAMQELKPTKPCFFAEPSAPKGKAVGGSMEPLPPRHNCVSSEISYWIFMVSMPGKV